MSAASTSVIAAVWRSELRYLFATPIGWITIAIFLYQVSFAYIGRMLRASRDELRSVTSAVFGNDSESAVSVIVFDNIGFYIPLIAMGAIARERQLGTLSYLCSAPVHIGQVVVGKYLALLSFVLFLYSFLFLAVLFTSLSVDAFQFGFAFSALLGNILVANLYLSLGFFASTISRTQVVAAIASIGLVLAIKSIPLLSERLPLVSSFLGWISLEERGDRFLDGLVVTTDLVYLFAIPAAFVAMSYWYLLLQTGGLAVRAVRYRVLGLAVAVASIILISAHPELVRHYDMTENGDNALTLKTKRAIAGAGDWSVHAYLNILDPNAIRYLGARSDRFERQVFGAFKANDPGLKVEYSWFYGPLDGSRFVGYTDDRLRTEAARIAGLYRLDAEELVGPDEVASLIDLEREGYRSFYVIKSANGRELQRTYAHRSRVPVEENLIATLIRLGGTRWSIGFTHGSGERSPFMKGPDTLRRKFGEESRLGSFVNLGFDIDLVSLFEPVPDHIEILVIAAPTRVLDLTELRNLEEFIERGGHGILFIDPHSASAVTGLLDLLNLDLAGNDRLATVRDFAPIHIKEQIAEIGFSLPFSTKGNPIAFFGSAYLTEASNGRFQHHSLSTSAMDSEGPSTSASEKMVGPVSLSTSSGEGKPAKWLVATDVKFVTNFVADSASFAVNDATTTNLLYGYFHWVTDGLLPFDTGRKLPADNSTSLSVSTLKQLQILLCVICPVLTVVLGSAILYRRRAN